MRRRIYVNTHITHPGDRLIESKQDSDGGRQMKERMPFMTTKPLSLQEIVFYRLLTNALTNHIVLAKVHVANFLKSTATDDTRWQHAINGLVVDFLICRNDGSPIAAVDFVDATQHPRNRPAPDTALHHALLSAGIKVFRWKSSEFPSADALHTAFN